MRMELIVDTKFQITHAEKYNQQYKLTKVNLNEKESSLR